MTKLQELFEFLESRDKLSPWVEQVEMRDFARFFNNELHEFDQARTPEAEIDELGDILILALTMVCKYGAPTAVFVKALEKLERRAPYVLRGERPTLVEEVEMWENGR